MKSFLTKEFFTLISHTSGLPVKPVIMNNISTRYFSFILLLLLFSISTAKSQNSVLVNFGNPACSTSSDAFFSIIRDPLTPTPSVLTTCDVTAQVPNFYFVFIAYNPKDNKIYVSDVRDGVTSKIWIMDMGLPGNVTCPSVIPVTPTYNENYSTNNFEFDNNGDLYSLSNYDITTGQCHIDRFDIASGTILSTKILQFPTGNFPTSIASGDLTILPNGRLFATLGSFPSRLYEVVDFNNSAPIATANYLQTIPQSCYGIAYLNGELELTGADFTSSCYYFDYDISTNTLGPAKVFQMGQLPIDNASITPAIATTKQLVNAVKINSNTADLTYEVYVKNYGNAILNNVNLTDDLGAVFGAANVSNVAVSFVPGANVPGLVLNPSYNGVSDINVLIPGQTLANNTASGNDYFFKVNISCRVTNLIPDFTYLNSAISSGNIGNTLAPINVSDSSNNGPSTVADPNNNGNPSENGENIPTPFMLSTLPVHFINIDASFTGKTSSLVKWEVATPMVNAEKFIVQFSPNGRTWTNLSEIRISNNNLGNYQFQHTNIPSGNLYYRIKQLDLNGYYTYSNVVLLRNQSGNNQYTVYPNPAKDYIEISAPASVAESGTIELYDAVGRKIISQLMTASTAAVNISGIPNGTYLLKIIHGNDALTQKIIVTH